MLDNITNVINENTKNVSSILDAFSGSGIVSFHLKKKGYNVISNDIMYFSYVLTRGINCLNEQPRFNNLKKIGIDNPIHYLNQLPNTIDSKNCFIYENYSPNNSCKRMYFQNHNALKIDHIRQTIDFWKSADLISEDEYFYLLATLICAVPYVANITGVYAAYLKHWDKRTFKNLTLEEVPIIKNNTNCMSFNDDINNICSNIEVDLAYFDPPYNGRQYLPNYHILETIAKYDNPIIQGISGTRDYNEQKSKYCMKRLVANSLDELIHQTNAKYILLSYNNEGLLNQKEITDIFLKNGKKDSFRYYEYSYRRYKSKIPNENHGLKEQLFFIAK